MRVALLLSVALIGAACTSGETPVAIEQPEVTTASETVLLTGPQAIEAAQGTPHILWFWGAN